MPSKYKSIREYEAHRENPFLHEAVENINIVKRQQLIRSRDRKEIQMIVNQEGEVEGYSTFMRFIEIEEERFAKVYLSQFENFWELSKPSIRVFGYIMKKLIPRKDEFPFDMEECLEYTRYSSERSVFEGIAGLIESAIIARGRNPYTYFINPLVVFNGDRVTFAKTFLKKKATQVKAAPAYTGKKLAETDSSSAEEQLLEG